MRRGDFATHIYREHDGVGDLHANTGAEEQKEVWVDFFVEREGHQVDWLGIGNGTAKTKRRRLWGEVLCYRKGGVVYSVQNMALPRDGSAKTKGGGCESRPVSTTGRSGLQFAKCGAQADTSVDLDRCRAALRSLLPEIRCEDGPLLLYLTLLMAWEIAEQIEHRSYTGWQVLGIEHECKPVPT